MVGVHTRITHPGSPIMSRSPIKRIAALPLTLAVVGVALIALSLLPADDAERDVAHADTEEVHETVVAD